MTGGRRRWLFALGAAAIVALLSLGGAALAGSLLSSPRAPLFEKSGSGARIQDVARVHHVVNRTHFLHQTNSRTPADDQYGNPLEGKLCADPSALTFFFAGHSTNDDFLMITNCGDATVNLGPPQQSNPGSPFRAINTLFDNSNQCPIQEGPFGVLPLQPGDHCVLLIGFGPQSPGAPSPPPGDYSDTWTFAGDNASVTVPMSRTVPTLPTGGSTTLFVSAFNAPDLSPACAAGPVDTGIDLAAGQEAVVTASGSATWFFPNNVLNGPNGPDGNAFGSVGYYVPGGPIAALIGRVGVGDWMAIGSGPTTVSGPGELQLAFDDAVQLCDNSGGFTVDVVVQAGP